MLQFVAQSTFSLLSLIGDQQVVLSHSSFIFLFWHASRVACFVCLCSVYVATRCALASHPPQEVSTMSTAQEKSRTTSCTCREKKSETCMPAKRERESGSVSWVMKAKQKMYKWNADLPRFDLANSKRYIDFSKREEKNLICISSCFSLHSPLYFSLFVCPQILLLFAGYISSPSSSPSLFLAALSASSLSNA